MKKMLLIVALVALVAPATFGRSYLMSQGSQWTTSTPTNLNSGLWTGTQPSNADANNTPMNPDWEYDSNNSERKSEPWAWPASYSAVNIVAIPVMMDVGFWIRIDGAQTLKLVLKQYDIHTYKGSVTFGVRCNASIILGTSWAVMNGIDNGLTGSLGHKEDLNGAGSSLTVAATNGSSFSVTLTETLTNVDLGKLTITGVGTGQCKQVGTITITVKPNFTPILAGGC